MARSRFRYRFTFFQKQFLSHLVIILSILVVLALGFTWYTKNQIHQDKHDELIQIARGIGKLFAKETEPVNGLIAARTVLNEKQILFIVMNRKGDQQYREITPMNQALRKTIIDGIRAKILTVKSEQVFLIEQSDHNTLMVAPKIIRPKDAKEDLVIFAISPIQGVDTIVHNINKAIAYSVILAFIFAIISGWFISRSMSRGVHALRQATQQLTDGDYATRCAVTRSDELGELAKDFNQMAEQLENQTHKLQQMEHRRHQFIMDASHELRTPLTSIRGIIEGFKNDLVKPEEQPKYFAIIEKETFRLIKLINELLDTEKVQSGLIELHKQTYPARELLEIVTECLDVQIEHKKLKFEIQCREDVTIYGDYDRLMQIMINLVKNAIQFTDIGVIELLAYETETNTILEVKDTGKGMTKVELEMIWERFYKADPSRSKEKGETGLGLSIVKQLVEAHQGTIHVDSTPGIGTTFRLSLPKTE